MEGLQKTTTSAGTLDGNFSPKNRRLFFLPSHLSFRQTRGRKREWSGKGPFSRGRKKEGAAGRTEVAYAGVKEENMLASPSQSGSVR